MLRKAFIRLTLLGIIAFAFFFAVISATKSPTTVASEQQESGSKGEHIHQRGDLILETLVGAILIGTN
jgi:hypothetical protein